MKPRRFLATPSYLRLWFAGGIGNAMRWLELLVAGVFTYDVTHSTFLVALVTVARSLPMLLAGALAGVIGEALNRKRILVAQLLVMAATSAALCVLALLGQVRVWHIILAGAVIGLDFRQEKRRLRLTRIAADIAEGVMVARRNPTILAVVVVSIIMNVFAFSYSAL